MAKESKVKAEVVADKYPDGTDIIRYPRWIYPGGKLTAENAKQGVHVADKAEHDAYVEDHPEFAEKAEGWDK